jgi:hypothetical protein
MNSEINENSLIVIYDTFYKEQQYLMNQLKNSIEDKTIKQLNKEINICHTIQLNLLKLKSLKKQYNEKIKNL